jgi:looped-hinge helix DNA binding domain, AbrB family
MRDTGVVRKLDELGRITIPMELRKVFGIRDRDSLQIYVENGKIILEKYAPTDIFTGESDDLVEFKGKKVAKTTIIELAKLAGLKIDNE